MSEGGARVHGLRAVWRQDTPIFPQAARDWQAGLVSHGFREGELEKGAGREAESEWVELSGGGKQYMQMTQWHHNGTTRHIHIDRTEKSSRPPHTNTENISKCTTWLDICISNARMQPFARVPAKPRLLVGACPVTVNTLYVHTANVSEAGLWRSVGYYYSVSVQHYRLVCWCR